jgi:hypothetical protein
MARRISGGTAGSTGLGGIQVTSTTLSAADNADITIDPSGTGIVKIAGDAQIQAQGDLRFADADSSNWVAFQAPTTVSSNVTWTLPAADGSNNQVLTTNASGTLSWTTAAVTISTETASSSTYYVPVTTTTSGSITSASVNNDATAGLRYIPSTGQLITGTLLVNGTVNSLIQETTARTADYTLELSDRDKVVVMNNTSTATVTVPPASSVAFPTGSVVYVFKNNSGTVNLAAGAGVTLTKTGVMYPKEELALRYRGSDVWSVIDGVAVTAASSSATDSLAATAGYLTSTFLSNGTYTVV